MKNRFINLLYALVVMNAFSCTKLIDIEFPAHERKPVIYAMPVPGEPLEVELLYSRGVNQFGLDYNINHFPRLFVNQQEVDTTRKTSVAKYLFEPDLKAGDELRLEVWEGDSLIAFANTKVPEINDLSIGAYQYTAPTNDLNINNASFEIRFPNLPEDEYFMLADLIKSKSFLGETTLEGRGSSLKSTIPILDKFLPRSVGFKDKFFAEGEIVIPLSIYYSNDEDVASGYPPNIYFLIVGKLSREKYLFFETSRNQNLARENFLAQVYEIYSNVTGGYGFFGAYDYVVFRFERKGQSFEWVPSSKEELFEGVDIINW